MNAGYIRRLHSPLSILSLIVFGWAAYGLVNGILTTETVFGLGFYASGLTSLYVVFYLVLGGGECFLHR
ncbi:nucleoside-diphosphate sugar epimerase [Halogeometricum borinquense]|uniref:nucleoside-diphosphate sugar epimerase n=1 Tax=Halogeometricum borinquense TaxID=60847 RepID=UPI00117DEB5C|nr:nucleoside-diphosphate sugar epimerase [Halogeometricum borinquense]